MSLLYCFDFSETLKSSILLFLLHVVSHKFEQQACDTKAQIQNHQFLLKFIIPLPSGFPGALPSTRQGMHPSISLETLKLRRMNLLQDSSCYWVSPEAPDVPGLSDAIGLDAAEELDAIR